MFYHQDCRHFSGYKPCAFKRPCQNCPHHEVAEQRILIISLEAMGAVLRSTVLLEPIKEQYPKSHITWITMPISKAMLEENPLIDRILTLDAALVPTLQHLKFDVLYCVDKSIRAGGLAEMIQAKVKKGFGLSDTGAIRPLNKEAEYQFALGLDDNLKFYKNDKPETQQITETMGFTWKKSEYLFCLNEKEKTKVKEMRAEICAALGSTQERQLIGYNTGCSDAFPYKRFTVEKAIEMIKRWRQEFPDKGIVLLGGPEDSLRQEKMKAAFVDDAMVFNSPTRAGLRAGFLWMDTCDVIFSGCSLGLHMAIALKKPTVAWFGVSCAHEIDLYHKGEKILASVGCTPCWKSSCEMPNKCFDLVDLDKVVKAVKGLL